MIGVSSVFRMFDAYGLTLGVGDDVVDMRRDKASLEIVFETSLGHTYRLSEAAVRQMSRAQLRVALLHMALPDKTSATRLALPIRAIKLDGRLA